MVMKFTNILYIIIMTLLVSARKKYHKSTKSIPMADQESEESIEYEHYKEINSKDNARTPIVVDQTGSLRKYFSYMVIFKEREKNVICSPLSALIPLGKLGLGAHKSTLQEILYSIGYENKREMKKEFKKLLADLRQLSGTTLSIVNRIYVDKSNRLVEDFITEVHEVFDSSIKKLDFEDPEDAAGHINEWIAKETRDKIPRVLTSDDIPNDPTGVILVNAIYFAGHWKEKFEYTTVGAFHGIEGTSVVTMMRLMGNFKYIRHKKLKAQVISLPYEKEEAAMIIVLPFRKNGIEELLETLNVKPELLNEALEELESTQVKVTMPKFTAEATLDLTVVYKRLGLYNMFEKEGFTGIVQDRTVHVMKAIQKAFIEVTEQGTVAAAATAVGVMTLSGKLGEEFKANHPFHFFIVANGQTLFSGVLRSP